MAEELEARADRLIRPLADRSCMAWGSERRGCAFGDIMYSTLITVISDHILRHSSIQGYMYNQVEHSGQKKKCSPAGLPMTSAGFTGNRHPEAYDGVS